MKATARGMRNWLPKIKIEPTTAAPTRKLVHQRGLAMAGSTLGIGFLFGDSEGPESSIDGAFDRVSYLA
jgi:hypothetical protein